MAGKRGVDALAVFLLCAIFATAPVGAANAAEDGGKLFFLSPAVSGYFPTSSKTRDAFGSSWWSIGVTLNMETLVDGFAAGGFSFSPWFGLYHADKNDNDAWVVPVGLQVRWGLSGSGSVRPYAGVGVAGYGIRFEDRDAGVDTGWRGAWGGRFLLGMDVTRWFNVEAAYNFISEVKDYDLSGFSLQGKFKMYISRPKSRGSAPNPVRGPGPLNPIIKTKNFISWK
ncbi:MAG: hypothetical protein LBT65_10880 [Synergistaceae bacterium]|nr:hypothetical protein [Synergistaceae bacterium]